jgi:hypothetical protein
MGESKSATLMAAMSLLSLLFLSILLRAIISDATATLTAAPSPVHAAVSDVMAKQNDTLSPLCAIIPDVATRPTAAPLENDVKLDDNNGSGGVVAI